MTQDVSQKAYHFPTFSPSSNSNEDDKEESREPDYNEKDSDNQVDEKQGEETAGITSTTKNHVF